MKLAIAIKKFMEADGGRAVSLPEMKEFLSVCNETDREEYAAWFRAQGQDVSV